MGNIKINDNDRESTNLSDDQTLDQTKDQETINPEFKVNTELLDSPEAPQVRVINNLS